MWHVHDGNPIVEERSGGIRRKEAPSQRLDRWHSPRAGHYQVSRNRLHRDAQALLHIGACRLCEKYGMGVMREGEHGACDRKDNGKRHDQLYERKA
jgi:hypothetical protein